jgi:hypothetical protein
MKMSDRKTSIEIGGIGSGLFFCILFVIFFWHTKVDCAIGVERACQIIADSYGTQP